MEELKIAICDDEEIFLEKMVYNVQAAMKELNRKYTLYLCQSGDELIKTCEKNNIELSAYLNLHFVPKSCISCQ